MRNPRFVTILQTLGMIICVSFSNVLVKLALNDVPPFTFVWLQIFIGGGLLTIYTFGLRGVRIPKGLGWKIWGYIIGIGVGNFTIVRVLFMLSLQRLPATTNIYLVNFVGIVTMLMSIYFLKERPTIIQILGAAIAMVGLWVFFDEIPPPSELIGVVYVGIGVLALAYTNNIARKLAVVTKNRLSNNMISTVAIWIGGSPVVAYGLIFDWPPKVVGVQNWAIILFSGVLVITIGLTVWNYILRTLRSYEASILGASSVIWTAIFAVPVLGERLAVNQIIGIALMLAGLSLVQVRLGITEQKSSLVT